MFSSRQVMFSVKSGKRSFRSPHYNFPTVKTVGWQFKPDDCSGFHLWYRLTADQWWNNWSFLRCTKYISRVVIIARNHSIYKTHYYAEYVIYNFAVTDIFAFCKKNCGETLLTKSSPHGWYGLRQTAPKRVLRKVWMWNNMSWQLGMRVNIECQSELKITHMRVPLYTFLLLYCIVPWLGIL